MVMVGVKDHRRCLVKVPLSLETEQIMRSLQTEQNLMEVHKYKFNNVFKNCNILLVIRLISRTTYAMCILSKLFQYLFI